MSKHSHEVTVDVDAPPEVVWQLLVDVEAMPTWTESMSEVERVDDVPLRLGSKVRIKQPKFPSTVWTVSSYTEGSEFSWEAKGPGTTTRGSHVIAAGDSTTTVTLRIDVTGPMAGALWRLSETLTRRYVQLEADGLARAATARSAG